MIIFHKSADLQAWALKNQEKWANAAFIPTMGALHPGHISLISTAQQQSELTVASIFVNPSQFNDPKDFEKYPSTIGSDIHMLETAGCDILFLPSEEEIYPGGWLNGEEYALGSLETLLEGYYRPGHFQGVCQVVHRLLDIVKPATIFMGQKDFQQCMVVRRLIEWKSLPVKMVTCPTLREADGLAMSSRNIRLTPEQRKAAPAIFREMEHIKNNPERLTPRELEQNATENLLNAGFKSVDYVSIAIPATLEPLEAWGDQPEAVVLVAAFMGEVRLIDNIIIKGLQVQ